MDRKVLRGIKTALLLEALFSGATSLSKVFAETGDELDDMIRYVDKKFQFQKALSGKLFNGKKH